MSLYPSLLRLIIGMFFVALVGCATLPKDYEMPESFALDSPYENDLLRFFEAELAANPGQSGFHLLGNNLDALVARGMLADVAEKTLDLQYYIFKDDEAAALVEGWILTAADRGVRVRILVDDLGTSGKDFGLAILDLHENISVRVFNPLAQRSGLKTDLLFVSKAERRMHNKTFIADNSAAIIGGRNIGNEYFTVPGARAFLDLDVLTVGPVVKDISESFDAFWNSQWAYPVAALFKGTIGQDELGALRLQLAEKQLGLENTPYSRAIMNSDLYTRLLDRDFPLVWAESEFLFDDPDKIDKSLDAPNALKTDFGSILDAIEDDFVMVTPYFVPGKNGMDFFKGLTERGVKARVMTNSLATNDVWIVHSGYAPYRKELLENGVELYEMKSTAFKDYREEFKRYVEIKEVRLHIKVLVIDHRYVVMGSSNFDPRSIDYNTEIGLVVDSPELAETLLDGFQQMTTPEHSYRLFLQDVEADDGRMRQKVRWEATEDGEKVVYSDEPGAGLWRKFGAWFMRAFPIEGKL